MTINQKPLDGGALAEIDLVEALRFVNEWEVRNSQAVALRVKIFRNYSVEFIEPFLKYHFGSIGVRCEISLSGSIRSNRTF